MSREDIISLIAPRVGGEPVLLPLRGDYMLIEEAEAIYEHLTKLREHIRTIKSIYGVTK
jgi:hypothetical protein